ncbi:MAG: hypothetical protein ACXACW_15300 [Candidatus Hodarchaeales archaeon]|jgi:hypothetical protein
MNKDDILLAVVLGALLLTFIIVAEATSSLETALTVVVVLFLIALVIKTIYEHSLLDSDKLKLPAVVIFGLTTLVMFAFHRYLGLFFLICFIVVLKMYLTHIGLIEKGRISHSIKSVFQFILDLFNRPPKPPNRRRIWFDWIDFDLE